MPVGNNQSLHSRDKLFGKSFRLSLPPIFAMKKMTKPLFYFQNQQVAEHHAIPKIHLMGIILLENVWLTIH